MRMSEHPFPNTHSLEIEYHEKLLDCVTIFHKEKLRRLKVKEVIATTEINDLLQELKFGNNCISSLEKERRDLLAQVSHGEEEISALNVALNNKEREIKNLKSQITSLDCFTEDTTKLVAEKLAFSRELAILRPEIHHLQSQVTQHKNILAEKLELERQISALKIELESEKDSTRQLETLQREHIKAKKEKTEAVRELELHYQSRIETLQKDLDEEKQCRENLLKDAQIEGQRQLEEFRELKLNYHSQIENLQKELAREKQSREKLLKDTQVEAQRQSEELRDGLLKDKENADNLLENSLRDLKLSETRRSTLEKKVEELWASLVTCKDQLKLCETELIQARESAEQQNLVPNRPISQAEDVSQRGSREKIEIAPADISTSAGTTRGTRAHKKRGNLEQATVGEKSLFSITPFLSRTSNLEMETPKIDIDDPEDSQTKNFVDSKSCQAPAVSSKPKGRKRVLRTKPSLKAVRTNKSEKQTEKKDEFRSATSLPENLLELKAAEIINHDNLEDLLNSQSKETNANSGQALSAPNKSTSLETKKAKPVKKKRKLVRVGKVATAGDDDCAPELGIKLDLGSDRLPGESLLSNFPGNTGDVVAAFSPLKRDRRSAGKNA